ncbi:hypothetical protein Tco_0107166, partial [Tanacetum coccineum]
MKKITRAAAVAIDNVLAMKGITKDEGNLHRTSQTKEQEIYKQISQISNHCHQTLLELSKPKNQHENIKESKEKLTPTQSILIQPMHLKESQQPLKLQLSKAQYQHLQKSMKSCDTRHKFVVEKDQEITTFKTFGQKYLPKPLKLEDCYKKPKSSPICSDTQFEESEDDNITVDPGLDNFCLTSAK